MELFANLPLITLLSLSFFALLAGFIDALVGGGGLIQLPALLINLPKTELATLFGTNKIAALSGTSISAYQYSRKIKFNISLLCIISLSAFVASYLGAKAVTHIPSDILKPVVFFLLIIIAIYTYLKKELGSKSNPLISLKRKMIMGALLALVVGFYDGFFGPGTGSFFVLGFVVLLGFDFLEASAYAKVINAITNISALVVFISHGNYLLEVALLMALFNVIGSFIGTHLAFSKGNKFIRKIFIGVVFLMIVRYGYDLYLNF